MHTVCRLNEVLNIVNAVHQASVTSEAHSNALLCVHTEVTTRSAFQQQVSCKHIKRTTVRLILHCFRM